MHAGMRLPPCMHATATMHGYMWARGRGKGDSCTDDSAWTVRGIDWSHLAAGCRTPLASACRAGPVTAGWVSSGAAGCNFHAKSWGALEQHALKSRSLQERATHELVRRGASQGPRGRLGCLFRAQAIGGRSWQPGFRPRPRWAGGADTRGGWWLSEGFRKPQCAAHDRLLPYSHK